MDDVKKLYETTELTIENISIQTNKSFKQVYTFLCENYSKEQRKERKKICYRNSKLGDKNPQFGMIGEKSAHFKGDVSDGKGYLMRVKPDWYTGRKGTKHVFTHHVVMCEHLKLTEIPKGFCVHHIDGDKVNNDIDNLTLLTISAHCKLHQLERATTRAKARRE